MDIKEQAAPFCCISGKVSDYTTNNAYLRSQMNETEQARYDAAAGLFSGMTAEEYQELAKLVKSQKAREETGTEKKQAVLQALMDRGLRRPGGGRLARVLVLSESPERRPGRPGWDADRAAGGSGAKSIS